MKLQYQGLEKFNCKKVRLSKSIYNAVYASSDKLIELMGEIAPYERIILDNDRDTYMYHNVRVNDGVVNITAIFMPFGLKIGGKIHLKDKKTEYWGEDLDKIIKKDEESADIITRLITHNIGVETFLQFAELEVKELKPNRQIYDGVTCLYNNKTKSDIQIIDSTWFTTLVKSDEFKVRGHFRLQPCGEYMAKRKLIWVSEFKKSGYTREAKKIKEFPTH